MNINLSKESTTTSILSMIFGAGMAFIASRYYSMTHTPEETIRRLETATAENKVSKNQLHEQECDTRKAINELKRTKSAYQAEIKPEIESKIRKELESYISKADETYEKAKHENELATLKLELAKQQAKSASSAQAFEWLMM